MSLPKPRRSKAKKGPPGKWVFVADSPEEAREHREQRVHALLSPFPSSSFHDRCATVDQFYDYCPHESQILPEGGGWVLVKNPPGTEYTVEPLSLWFAEAWPMDGDLVPYRIKVVTPQGMLGLFPHEYAAVDVNKYIEFIGHGYSAMFFTNPTGITDAAFKEKLLYIRSRGVGKAEAFSMLIGELKQHGVLWLDADQEVKDSIGYRR